MDFMTFVLGLLIVGLASWTVAAALVNRAPHRANFLTAAVAALGLGLLGKAFDAGDQTAQVAEAGAVPGFLAHVDPLILALFGCFLYCLLTLVRWWRTRR